MCSGVVGRGAGAFDDGCRWLVEQSQRSDKQKMSPDGERNRGNLQLVRVERTPEEWLDLEFAEGIAALEVQRGRQRPVRFHRIQSGERHPMRVPARVVSDGLAARIPSDALIGLVTRCLKRYAMRKQRVPVQDSGEWRPAA